jgi:hypothetical protein
VTRGGPGPRGHRVGPGQGSRVRALVLVGSGLAGHPFREPALLELWDQSEGAIERGDHLEAARVELDTWVVGVGRDSSAVTPEVRRRVEAMLLAA